MPESHPATVVFQAIGRDARIADLDSLTATPLYNDKQQLSQNDGPEHFIELAVISAAEDDDRAVASAHDWLQTHRELLRDLDADTMLEFQTTIEPECGSKAIVLPAPFLQLLGSVGAKLVHQYIRVLSGAELAQLRREGRGPQRDSPT